MLKMKESKQIVWSIHRLAKEYGVTPSHYLMGSQAIFSMDYAVYSIGIKMDYLMEERARKEAEKKVQHDQNAHLRPYMQ